MGPTGLQVPGLGGVLEQACGVGGASSHLKRKHWASLVRAHICAPPRCPAAAAAGE